MADQPSLQKSNRLISLDAFRGYTIAAMIIVNDPGSWSHVYAPLLHAQWHGATPTDLVFPFFLFIVGVSIALAFTKRIEKGSTKGDLMKKAVIRSIKIFALGIFLNIFPEQFIDFNLADIRIPGVLQRIAIVYLVCSFIYLQLNSRKQIYLGIIFLVGYWLLMTVVPVPGVGPANLEPGTNLAAWFDNLVIPLRLYRGTWDPEGLLSTFPAFATGISGMLVGKIILSDRSIDRRVVWLFFMGFIGYLVGIAWGWGFPINKNLWTSSYVLYSSGLATMALAAFIWFVDVLGYDKGAKFGIIYGSNAITIYVLAGMFPSLTHLGGEHSINSLFFNGLVDIGLAPKFVSLLWAILYCLVCFIPAYFMYKKKIFIKV